MSEFADLEQRLSSYGSTLADELATWPTFNPATMAASTPLQLLWRRRGRWLGAGHRPPFAGVPAIVAGVLLAVLAAIALLLVFRPGGDDTRSVESDAASVPLVADASDPGATVELPSSEDAASSDPTVPEAGGAASSPVEAEPEPDASAPDAPTPDAPAPVAAAVEPEREAAQLVCRSGLLVNGQCRISSPAPVEQRTEACAAKGGVGDGEAGCFRSVDAAVSCPSPSQDNAGECQIVTAPRAAPPTCPQGGELDGDVCRSVVPVTRACADGVEVEGVCRREGPPAEGGELVCTGSGRIEGGTCKTTVAGVCDSGISVPGGCAVPGPVEQTHFCPSGASLNGDLCVPDEGCQPSEQTKKHTECGRPPTVELICVPTGAISNGADCFTSVPATCPAGSTDTGAGCVVRTAAAPTPFQCAEGQTLIGTSCFDERPVEPSCVEGVLAPEGCVVTRAATASEPTCPAAASLRAGQCVVVVAGDRTCETGEPVDGQCRVPVELEETLLCMGDAQFDRGWCVRFEDPVER